MADPTDIPPAPPTKRTEQLEYERLDEELSPIVEEKLAGVSPLVPAPAAMLVVLAALLHQAANLAMRYGLRKEDYLRRSAQIAERAYAPRVEVPKLFVG